MGKKLNSPNDLVYHSNGDLYFTDPPYGLPKWADDPARELDLLRRLSAQEGRQADPAHQGNDAGPTASRLSPDEKTLYVANSDPEAPIWMAFPVKADGTLGEGKVFFDATKWVKDKRPGLPDGMKVDVDGNLCATGPGGVWVFAPDGTLLGTIDTGTNTANCAFGDDGSMLYIAANHDICRVRDVRRRVRDSEKRQPLSLSGRGVGCGVIKPPSSRRRREKQRRAPQRPHRIHRLSPYQVAEVAQFMPTCPACCKELPVETRFCPICGERVHAGTGETTATHHPAELLPLPAPATPRFAPGQILAGRYRIVSRLGAGGMGEVFRADDLRLGQSVALKFFPLEWVNDWQRLAHLHEEVRFTRQISHANVCRVYDIGEAAAAFLSMEYIDGEDLASLLRRIGRLPPDKGLEIARQLCLGLAAAHERGVIHRDLKPANIMVDGRGRSASWTSAWPRAVRAGPGGDIRPGPRPTWRRNSSPARSDRPQRHLFAGPGTVRDLHRQESFSRHVAGGVAKLQESSHANKSIEHAGGARSNGRAGNPALPGNGSAAATALPHWRCRRAAGGDPLAAALAAGENAVAGDGGRRQRYRSLADSNRAGRR